MVASVSDPMMAMGRSFLGLRACTAASQARQNPDAAAQLLTSQLIWAGPVPGRRLTPPLPCCRRRYTLRRQPR